MANYLQITSQFFPALRVSLLLGLCAGIVNMVLTIPAGYALTRYSFRGQNLLNAFFLAPNMVPAISLALGLLALYSRRGMPDMFWGLTCALAIVTMPYMLRPVLAAGGSGPETNALVGRIAASAFTGTSTYLEVAVADQTLEVAVHGPARFDCIGSVGREVRLQLSRCAAIRAGGA